MDGAKSVKLDITCGFATTSNSDRHILAFPESLRSSLRPYSIMSPDRVGITEVLLTSMGIANSNALAKKTFFAFSLLDHALPGIEDSEQADQELPSILVAEMEEDLSPSSYTVQKVVELSQCLRLGKGVLMCGKCNSGKTIARDVFVQCLKKQKFLIR